MRLPIVLGLIAATLAGIPARAQTPDPGDQAQAAVAGQLASALSASQGQVARLQAQVQQLQAQLKAAEHPAPPAPSASPKP